MNQNFRKRVLGFNQKNVSNSLETTSNLIARDLGSFDTLSHAPKQAMTL
jgi:hypothetical protein